MASDNSDVPEGFEVHSSLPEKKSHDDVPPGFEVQQDLHSDVPEGFEVSSHDPTLKQQLYTGTDPIDKGISGAINSVKDAYHSFVNDDNLISKTLKGAQQAYEDVGLQGAQDAVLNAAGETLSSGKHALGYVAGLGDRAMGTAMMYTAWGATGVKPEWLKKAQERDIQDNVNVVDGIAQSRLLPVSMSQDMVQDPIANTLNDAGLELQKSDSKVVRKTGEVLEAFAGPLGGVAAVGASYAMDPFSLWKLGKLTEAGIEAEKAGQLEAGWGRQMEAGQREGLTLRALNKEFSPQFVKPLTKSAYDTLASTSAKLEMTKPGQWLRNYTPLTGFDSIDGAAKELSIGQRGLEKTTLEGIRDVYSKAEALGVNYGNAETRAAFNEFLDSPSTWKPSKALNAQGANSLYYELNKKLGDVVSRARAVGIPIPEFEPKNLLSGDSSIYSERYVPRYATINKQQELMVAKMYDDAKEAQKYVEDLGLSEGKSSRAVDKSFMEGRSKLTREAINAKLEADLGVKDFFHDDAILAYHQKISDIEKSILQKQFVDKLAQNFPTTKSGYVRLVGSARLRIQEAEAMGISPHPEDLKLARIRLDTLGSTNNGALEKVFGIDSARLKSIGAQDQGFFQVPFKTSVKDLKNVHSDVKSILEEIGKGDPALKGIENIVLPGPVADLTNSLFRTPDQGAVEQFMQAYQRAWKNAKYVNPAFYERNIIQHIGSLARVGGGPIDMVKATIAQYFEKGSTAKYADEMAKWDHGYGTLTDISKGTAPLNLDEAAYTMTKEMYGQDNPMLRTQNVLHEMAMKGTFQSFLGTLRNQFTLDKNVLVDNPIYRLAIKAGTNGEQVPKLAYYAKLRESGYSEQAAMIKTNDNFLNFEMTRDSVRKNQMWIPFLNHATRNADLVFRTLAQNPRNFAMLAPGGAFERAIERWWDWHPGQDQRFKEMFGNDYLSDHVLVNVMPSGDTVENQKDFIKKYLNKWMLAGTQGGITGQQLMLSLPSNYHTLSMLDPSRINEMKGPIVGMGLAMLGIDPFTGENFVGGNAQDTKWNERLHKAAQALDVKMAPMNAINAARQVFAANWPDYEKHLVNLGLPESTANFLFGDPNNDKAKQKMQQALAHVKTAFMGSLTRVDSDIFIRQQAELRQAQTAVQALLHKSAKANDGSIGDTVKRVKRIQQRAADRMMNLINIKSDYDKRATLSGGGADPRVTFTEDPSKIMGEIDAPQGEPAQSQEEFDKDGNEILDKEYGPGTGLNEERQPQAAQETLLDRGSRMTKQHMEPQVNEYTPPPYREPAPQQNVPRETPAQIQTTALNIDDPKLQKTYSDLRNHGVEPREALRLAQAHVNRDTGNIERTTMQKETVDRSLTRPVNRMTDEEFAAAPLYHVLKERAMTANPADPQGFYSFYEKEIKHSYDSWLAHFGNTPEGRQKTDDQMKKYLELIIESSGKHLPPTPREIRGLKEGTVGMIAQNERNQ